MAQPITSQKLYAILRKAGYRAAKWETSGMVRGWGEYSTGPRVYARDNSGSLYVTYESGHRRDAAVREHDAMHNFIVPVLEAAGIQGEWVEHTIWRVSLPTEDEPTTV